jgi:hypothetical protein
MIELIDIFLLGTILYIVALGLYELFIDATLPVPSWLQIATLDDLKDKLVGVVVVLLAVTFLGRAVVWNGSGQILPLGAAIALVIAALALPRWQRTKDGKPGVAPGADRARRGADRVRARWCGWVGTTWRPGDRSRPLAASRARPTRRRRWVCST